MRMKKKITGFILAGIMALPMYGCGSKELPEADDTYTEEGTNEETFSFADLENVRFCFSSGAGGWATMLTIDADGSFSGEWFDGELGVTGEEYPNGTMYQSDFSGQFTQPVKVNAYTYSVQIHELNYEEEIGREEIRDGVLYCYGDAYGLEEAENILIYLPGAPLAELPEEFRSWVGYYDLSETADTVLPFYGLYNETQQCGFSGYNIVDSLKESISRTEECAASLEDSIRNDSLTQDTATMSELITEEREWIIWKEQEAAKAGAAYEGGSMQEMVMNQKAAELTKTRVYELLELPEQE